MFTKTMFADKYKLYNNDCTKLISYLPKAKLVLTDPPYPNKAGHFIDGIDAANEFISNYDCDHWFIFWDEMTEPPCRLPLVAKHIWHRSNTNRPDNYEMIYEYNIDGKKRASRVLNYPVIYPGLTGCVEAIGHPTQKNRKLIYELIRMSKEDGLIIDPFFGSNTTGVVCAKYGIDYIGIEKDKFWFDKGKQEMENELSQGKLFQSVGRDVIRLEQPSMFA